MIDWSYGMGGGFPLVLLGIVCLVSAVVYVALMIFLPEWVGITGKTALKNEQEHREGSLEIDRLHTEHREESSEPPSSSKP